MTNLQDLSLKLNTHETPAGTTFMAEYLDDSQTLKVICSSNPDAMIFVVASDEQILSVTPLFKVDDIADTKREELNNSLLRLSPVVPLSAIGLQDDDYILYGAMSVNTIFENVAHELECQSENYSEVLAALSDFFTCNAPEEA